VTREKVPPSEATTDEVMNKLSLYQHRDRFDGFAAALSYLNTQVPGRTTGRQLQAFAFIAAANTRGMRVTLTDLKETPETESVQRATDHMNNAYQMFLPPSVKDPNALGWIVQEPDLYDGRKKYLVLNDEGRRIATEMGDIIERFEPTNGHAASTNPRGQD
jgi:hypothetical protein